MTNAQTTRSFLSVIDSKTKHAILQNIATHYGITESEALAEVTNEESEHLLDYVTGQVRTATSLSMKRFGFH